PDPDRASQAETDAWLARMLAACEQGAPGKLHLHAEYDATWYQDDMPFTPGQAARHGGVTAVHSWVFNGTAQRHARTSVPTEHHAAYLVELCKAWADDPHRPVWLQEVGAPAPLIPPEHAAAFTEATIAGALDCPDLWGITWWCSHDVSRDLADFPELEYGLGLLTNDRRPKDTARVLARAAAREHTPPASRTTALVVPADPATRSFCAPGGPVFDAFFRLTADGARPTTVLDTRADDKDHLAARGITEVVTPEQVLRTPQGGTSS
ncbi:MAG: glycosyl hydrolase, partial [Streptomyces sp.]|nr:glycosyl hydrolase [Streptomyces sp.]